MPTTDLLSGLPGETLVRQGLADARAGRLTVEFYLVRIARPRLQRCGLLAPETATPTIDDELALYRLLRQQGGDAYARYNALLGELVSFEMALDRRWREAQSARQDAAMTETGARET